MPTGAVDEAQLSRLDTFAVDIDGPDGAIERGLTAVQLSAMMDANFARAAGPRAGGSTGGSWRASGRCC